MPISDYMRGIREKVGTDLVLIPSVGAAIFDEEGRMLMVRHASYGIWNFPGGAIDPGESPADAAIREVWEETGLRVRPKRILAVFGGEQFAFAYANGDEIAYVLTLFECVLEGEAEIKPDGVEVNDARFVDVSELATLNVPDWTRELLPTVYERRPEAFFLQPSWSPPST